jgi:hypothetical protein
MNYVHINQLDKPFILNVLNQDTSTFGVHRSVHLGNVYVQLEVQPTTKTANLSQNITEMKQTRYHGWS